MSLLKGLNTLLPPPSVLSPLQILASSLCQQGPCSGFVELPPSPPWSPSASSGFLPPPPPSLGAGLCPRFPAEPPTQGSKALKAELMPEHPGAGRRGFLAPSAPAGESHCQAFGG